MSDKITIVTVPVTLDVPKEGKELIDLIALLVSHFKNGGSVLGLTGHLGTLKAAVSGAGEVKDEIQSQFKDELAAYTVHKIWSSLDSGDVIILDEESAT